METSGVSATTTAATQTKATTHGFDDLGSEDFFKLLITELQSQDPMKPTDNQQLMSELSSIRQMQQTSTLNTTLQTLAAQERFGSTAGLIGHYVSGTVTNDAGASATVQGVVIGVQFDSKGEAVLELHNGHNLPASKVEQVTLVENLPASVQQQLQQELSQMANGSGSNSSARLVTPGATSTGKLNSVIAANSRLRGVTQNANSPVSVLDALLSRDIGV